jgi:outer membrane biosynthesis protein TonB
MIPLAVTLAAAALLPAPALHAGLPSRPRISMMPNVPPPPPPSLTLQPPPGPPLPPPGAGTTSNYSLNRDVVRRVIYLHINQIRNCYQQALIKQRTLAGRLVVIFDISAKGQIEDLLIGETTLASPPLLQCISETMRTWEFPPTPYYNGTVRVVYPFVLRPKVPDAPAGVEVTDEELAKLGILKDPEPPPVDVLF